jgi:HSP20 family protein
MMNLIPWKNRVEGKTDGGATSLARLRTEMDELFDQFIRDPWGSLAKGVGAGPLMDVAETDKEVTVSAELPGVDPKDIDIDVTGDMLTVRGEKKQEHEEKDRNYTFVERSFGRFQRSIQLPSSVDPDKVEATCRNGTLTITLSKKPDAQRKKIQVKEG